MNRILRSRSEWGWRSEKSSVELFSNIFFFPSSIFGILAGFMAARLNYISLPPLPWGRAMWLRFGQGDISTPHLTPSECLDIYVCVQITKDHHQLINYCVLSDNLKMEDRRGRRSQTKPKMWCQPTLSDGRNAPAPTRPINMCRWPSELPWVMKGYKERWCAVFSYLTVFTYSVPSSCLSSQSPPSPQASA